MDFKIMSLNLVLQNKSLWYPSRIVLPWENIKYT